MERRIKTIYACWTRSGSIVSLPVPISPAFSELALVQKYGRNQEMLRFGQLYARLNKLVSLFPRTTDAPTTIITLIF